MNGVKKSDSAQIAEIKLALIEAIVAEMERRNLSQRDLAQMVGGNSGNMSKAFRGLIPTSVDYFVNLSVALGLKVKVTIKRS